MCSEKSQEVLRLTIPVAPRSKKNSMQIVKFGDRPSIRPSRIYSEYEKAVLKVIPQEARLKINYPVNIQALFFAETRRKVDITNLNSALHDVLTKAGVLADDNRDIVVSSDGSRVFWDKVNPRTEVIITRYTDPYEVWHE